MSRAAQKTASRADLEKRFPEGACFSHKLGRAIPGTAPPSSPQERQYRTPRKSIFRKSGAGFPSENAINEKSWHVQFPLKLNMLYAQRMTAR